MLAQLAFALIAVDTHHNIASIDDIMRNTKTAKEKQVLPLARIDEGRLRGVENFFRSEDYEGIIRVFNSEKWTENYAKQEDFVVMQDKNGQQDARPIPMRVGLARIGFCTNNPSPNYEINLKIAILLTNENRLNSQCKILLAKTWTWLQVYRFKNPELLDIALSLVYTPQRNIVICNFLNRFEGSMWFNLFIDKSEGQSEGLLKLVIQMGEQAVIEFLRAAIINGRHVNIEEWANLNLISSVDVLLELLREQNNLSDLSERLTTLLGKDTVSSGSCCSLDESDDELPQNKRRSRTGCFSFF